MIAQVGNVPPPNHFSNGPSLSQHRGKTSAHAWAQKSGEEFKCQIVNKNMAIQLFKVPMQRNVHLIFYCFSKKYRWSDEE
jgi:hypothetical protein